jgi:hypothetical protein
LGENLGENSPDLVTLFATNQRKATRATITSEGTKEKKYFEGAYHHQLSALFSHYKQLIGTFDCKNTVRRP